MSEKNTNVKFDRQFYIDIVGITKMNPDDTVDIVGSEEQIAKLCERANLPVWLYDTVIAAAGHSFGDMACLEAAERAMNDPTIPQAERVVNGVGAGIARQWLYGCKTARDENREYIIGFDDAEMTK
jgi:hypothetical protein